jgi:hypothetical protein
MEEITPPSGISERQLKTFYTYLSKDGSCILWNGALGRGYALYTINGKLSVLHRTLWIQQKGPLGDRQLDHLCRKRNCINLDHLEPVSNKENILRGIGPSAINKRKTHCPKNHAFDKENTYLDPLGRRHCRECSRKHSRNWKAKNRQA